MTSKIEKEKQPQEYRWDKIDFDTPEDIYLKLVTINPDPDILWTPYDYFKYFINDEMLSIMAYQTNLYTTQKNIKLTNTN